MWYRPSPTLLNTLLLNFCLNYPEFPMPKSRRNAIIRTVAVIAGDIATGVAVASVCAWLIETAALGLFLSFLVWLVGVVAALAFSQYVVHPAAKVLLCDHKLDAAVRAVSFVCGIARSTLRPA